MSEVKQLRLVTGEDIIAKIESKNTDTVTIRDAFVIIPRQEGPGKPVSLMFTHYAPFTEEKEIEISKDKVVFQVKPKDEILNAYQQNTSNIITPNKQGLITETSVPTLGKK